MLQRSLATSSKNIINGTETILSARQIDVPTNVLWSLKSGFHMIALTTELFLQIATV